DGLSKVAVGIAYFATVPLQIAWAVLTDPTTQHDCEGCPTNPILIGGHEGLAEAVNFVQVLSGIVAIVLAIWVLYAHWRGSSATERRVLSPVVFTGSLAFTILLTQLIVGEIGVPEAVKDVFFAGAIAVFTLLPFAFLLGLLRSRIGRAEEATTALSAENAELT